MSVVSIIPETMSSKFREGDYVSYCQEQGLTDLTDRLDSLERLSQRVCGTFDYLGEALRGVEGEADSGEVDYRLYKNARGQIDKTYDLLRGSLRDYSVASNELGKLEVTAFNEHCISIEGEARLALMERYVVYLDGRQKGLDCRFEELIGLCDTLANNALQKRALIPSNKSKVGDSFGRLSNTLTLMQLNTVKESLLKRGVIALEVALGSGDFEVQVDPFNGGTYNIACHVRSVFNNFSARITAVSDQIEIMSSSSNIETNFINRGIKMLLKEWREAGDKKSRIDSMIGVIQGVIDRKVLAEGVSDKPVGDVIEALAKRVKGSLMEKGEGFDFRALPGADGEGAIDRLESMVTAEVDSEFAAIAGCLRAEAGALVDQDSSSLLSKADAISAEGIRRVTEVIQEDTQQEKDLEKLIEIKKRLGHTFPRPSFGGLFKAFFMGIWKMCGFYDSVKISAPNFNKGIVDLGNLLSDGETILTPKNVAGFFHGLLSKIEDIKRYEGDKYYELKKSLIQFKSIADLFLTSSELDADEFSDIKIKLKSVLESFGDLSYSGTIGSDILTKHSLSARWLEGWWGPCSKTISERYFDRLGEILSSSPFEIYLNA